MGGPRTLAWHPVPLRLRGRAGRRHGDGKKGGESEELRGNLTDEGHKRKHSWEGQGLRAMICSVSLL